MHDLPAGFSQDTGDSIASSRSSTLEEDPYARELLIESDWLQRLARRIAPDDARANDLLQQTYLEALEHPPAHKQQLRGWLTVVMRFVSTKMARSERNRLKRERRVARGILLEPPASPLDAEEIRQQIGEILRSLKEPYQRVLVLRYFEDLSPAQIAQRIELPIDTVYTHLHRAHAQLRRRLRA